MMRNSRVNCVPLCSADFGRICLNTVFIQCIGHFLCMGRVAILGWTLQEEEGEAAGTATKKKKKKKKACDGVMPGFWCQ